MRYDKLVLISIVLAMVLIFVFFRAEPVQGDTSTVLVSVFDDTGKHKGYEWINEYYNTICYSNVQMSVITCLNMR